MRRFRWLVLLAVIASAALLWSHHRASVVRYNGRSIETWFDELNGVGPATNAAKDAILAIGSNAVPFLVAQLTNGPAFRETYFHYKQKLPVAFRQKLPAAPILTKVNWDRRERAAVMLGELGPVAKPALPALVDLVHYVDWVEAPTSSRSLGKAWNPRLRVAAFIAIERIDIDDPHIVGAITNVLKEGIPTFRVGDPAVAQAAQTFGHLKNPSDESIRTILKILAERNSELYWRELGRFCGTLIPGGAIGHPFSEINSVTNTVIALTSTDPRAREAAAYEFGDLDREGYSRHPTHRLLPNFPDQVVTNLVECLNDPLETVRLNAAETLFRLKKSEDSTVPVLISLLDSTNSFNQLRSIEILRQIGKAARPALPKLITMKSNPAAFLGHWADRAIEEIQ